MWICQPKLHICICEFCEFKNVKKSDKLQISNLHVYKFSDKSNTWASQERDLQLEEMPIRDSDAALPWPHTNTHKMLDQTVNALQLFFTKSFHTKTLYSRLSSREVKFSRQKLSFFVLSPQKRLRGNAHCSSGRCPLCSLDLGYFGPRTELYIQFGPWSLQS